MTWNDFKGAAKRIDDTDLPRIGHKIGVGEDEIHAVLDIEAAGSGFDSKGRPKMLFEPHIFYRQLKGAQRTRAVNEGLAYLKWRRNYPKDSYPRLERAMRINETAALKSASWGRGQIMGFNHSASGYATVQDMVRAFMDDEETHLEAMVQFIISNGLDDELRRHDWRGFARGYNGPGYAENGYHTKLAAAYRKWSRIKDTAWSPDMDKPKPPVIDDNWDLGAPPDVEPEPPEWVGQSLNPPPARRFFSAIKGLFVWLAYVVKGSRK